METHKSEVQNMFQLLSWTLKGFDPDGIEIQLASSPRNSISRTSVDIRLHLNSNLPKLCGSSSSDLRKHIYIMKSVSEGSAMFRSRVQRKLVDLMHDPDPLLIFIIMVNIKQAKSEVEILFADLVKRSPEEGETNNSNHAPHGIYFTQDEDEILSTQDEDDDINMEMD